MDYAPSHRVPHALPVRLARRVLPLAHESCEVRAFAVYTYTTVLNSGNNDLFIAFTVFLPFAFVVSALSIGMNMRLLGTHVRVRLAPHAGHRQPLRQGSGQQLSSSQHDGPSETHRARKQLLWQQLAQRIVVQRAQLAHQERTSANDIELKHFGMSMLLLLTEVRSQRAGRRSHPAGHSAGSSARAAQDLPLFVITTVLLVRTVRRKDDVAVLAQNKFCSTEYNTAAYVSVLLNTMKTAGMLATKVIKVKHFPQLWMERQALQAGAQKLAQRVAALEGLQMAALSDVEPADDDSVDERPEHAGPYGDAPASTALPEPSYTIALSLRLAECALEWATRMR